ncbi:SOS response-associated peptidase family protein [Roseomonas mucosa]|uniref:SOS response-associated peptidase family protein n=1 Tax=Roseomonas mucosa TaxID=207340 RepID=UPI0037CCBDB3
MCNRYADRISYCSYFDTLKDTPLPLVRPGPDRAPNLEPRDNIRPTDRGQVLLPVEGGLELREMRWGLIPWFHRKPVKEWKVLTTTTRAARRSTRSPATKAPSRSAAA